MIALAKVNHLLLLAPDETLADKLEPLLRQNGFHLHHAVDRSRSLELLHHYPCELLLVSGEEGLALCRQLRTQGEAMPILLLVEDADILARANAIDAGISDLVSLPLDMAELLLQLRSQTNRLRPVNGQILTFQDVNLNVRTREVWRGGQSLDLTAKEYDLLRLLLLHPQHILSREQILREVWGSDFTGESNIIEVYIRYLRLKLEKEGQRKLIHTVRGVGYVLRE